MQTDDFLYTDIKFRWTMDTYLFTAKNIVINRTQRNINVIHI